MKFAYDKPEYMTLFRPYKLTILGPAKMYLKSVSMVNTETYIVINFQATFSHFGNQTAK